MIHFEDIVKLDALKASIDVMQKVEDLMKGFDMAHFVVLPHKPPSTILNKQLVEQARHNGCGTTACALGWCAVSGDGILAPKYICHDFMTFPTYRNSTFFYNCDYKYDLKLDHLVSCAVRRFVSNFLFSHKWHKWNDDPEYNRPSHYIYRVESLLKYQDEIVSSIRKTISENNPVEIYTVDNTYSVLMDIMLAEAGL